MTEAKFVPLVGIENSHVDIDNAVSTFSEAMKGPAGEALGQQWMRKKPWDIADTLAFVMKE